jgi:hypothetical protein
MMSRDVRFDQNVRYASSWDSLLCIKGSEEVVFTKTNLDIRARFYPKVDEVRLGVHIPSPSTPPCKSSRCLTKTYLQYVHDHVGAPRSSVRMTITPRRCFNHIALVSSMCKPSSYFQEEMCDALMEDDVRIGSKTIVGIYFHMVSLIEL